ncbi:MAG: choice-of-anchor D domain-containing protein, partial [Solirubrobacterales bacterium]|nr:choice-of-anchor D domain-containing protein [Solirubrobacterales bacterium]
PKAPQIVVDPQDGLDFGTVCGGGPAYLTLTVYNVGGADLIVDTVTNIAGSADFTVLPNPATPLTIASGDEVAFTVEFTPSSPGAESATIRITSNDPVTPNLDLVAIGTGGTGALELALADSGNFGEVCLGSFVDRPLVLVNNGPCRLHVTNISASPDFLTPTVKTYPLTIGSGDALELPVRFQPTALGVRSAVITVTSDDPAGPKTISVTGTAPSPKLALVMADSGNFGRVCRGHFADEPLVLVNSGHCPLSVTAISSSSPTFLVPSVTKYPLVVEGGGSLAVPIRFQPAHHGHVTGTITVVSDDPTGPQSVSVSGDAPSGRLAVSGSAYFGEVDCGAAEKTISICNIGQCALHISSVEFKRPRRHFKLVDNPFPATLPVGACLGVVIRYTASCEPECCELVIRSDDPEEPVRCLDVIAYTRCRCERDRCGCGHTEPCGCAGGTDE